MAKKKKTAKKTASKSSKKSSAEKKKKGDKFVGGVCGLKLVVDEACGCSYVKPVVCCGKKMTVRKK